MIPHNKLTEEEQSQILKVVNQSEYANLSPATIVPKLADQGKYLASESTMYRLLRKENQLTHRAASRPRNTYRPKAIIATKPNQVYSWDITYLGSTIKGSFFYLYLIMDIYSRKIVGWQVYDRESSEYASDVLEAACVEENIKKDQLILHSDNGGPMKGATMLSTLQKLGVIPSFSRPSVSNDNPYSEALFKTLKYIPIYSDKPFVSLQKAREWVEKFVEWYNYHHLHSGIKFITPIQRHNGNDAKILKNRTEVYLKAKNKHPNRWSRKIRNWNKENEVHLNPEKGKNLKQTLRAVI
jgi:putative transposase